MKSGVISSRLRDMNNKLTFQHDCIGNIKDNQILTVHCEMTYNNFAKKNNISSIIVIHKHIGRV